MSDKIDFKSKCIRRDREEQYILIKGKNTARACDHFKYFASNEKKEIQFYKWGMVASKITY